MFFKNTINTFCIIYYNNVINFLLVIDIFFPFFKNYIIDYQNKVINCINNNLILKLSEENHNTMNILLYIHNNKNLQTTINTLYVNLINNSNLLIDSNIENINLKDISYSITNFINNSNIENLNLKDISYSITNFINNSNIENYKFEDIGFHVNNFINNSNIEINNNKYNLTDIYNNFLPKVQNFINNSNIEINNNKYNFTDIYNYIVPNVQTFINNNFSNNDDIYSMSSDDIILIENEDDDNISIDSSDLKLLENSCY